MPAVKARIKLCSNLMREPQVFDQLGDLAGGFARDLIIYGAALDQDQVVLHVPHFCEMMGYKRANLLLKLTDKQKEWMVEHGAKEDHLKKWKNAIGYTIRRMGIQSLEFALPAEDTKDKSKYRKNDLRFRYKRLIGVINLESLKTGTLITYVIDPEIMEHSRRKNYQTIYTADYLSLKTKGGRADDKARKMYMRLAWKRQYWDSLTKKKGYKPSVDTYDDLKAVAGFNYSREKKNAYLLNNLLKRVGQLPSIKMTPKMRLNNATGKYEVSWTRDELELEQFEEE